jgi:hypothetical protein
LLHLRGGHGAHQLLGGLARDFLQSQI